MSMNLHRRSLMSVASAIALGAVATMVLAKPKERVIKVVAKKFVFVPEEIRIRQGETVVIELTAPEVPMGFFLPDLAMRTDIMPGKVSTLRLTVDKAGSYGFLCDVFCGSGHEDMGGMLIVS